VGFLRKAIIIGTGGLAPIKAQSYRERQAKATEQLVRIERQRDAAEAYAAAPKIGVRCPYCGRAQSVPRGTFRCENCHGKMLVSGSGDVIKTR